MKLIKTRYMFMVVAFASLSALIGGCSGSRNLANANIEMPQEYLPGLVEDSACVADMKWWEFYTDTILARIIHTALDNNRDLLKAAATVERMRNLYGVAKANMLPTIGGEVGANHETNNYNGDGNVNDLEFDLKFPIAWEINLMGSLSHAKKSAGAKYIASVEDYRAMRMIIISETASAYFNLIALESELKIVRHTLITREEALKQAKLRFEGGLTPETVYQQAKVEYSSTASLVPDLERRVQAARNALTLLMGEFPTELFQKGDLAFNEDFDGKIPVGIPSTLLTRRPDLRASEMRLKAALEEVGVAYADRFPNLRIQLVPGFENDRLADFFKSPFSYVLGSVTGSIFDFGRKKRKYKAMMAAYDEVRYDYEQDVISAFTEVNTAVVAYGKYRENRRLKSELRDAAAKYVQLAHLQYMGGTLNYIDVLDAQRRYFEAQIGVNNSLRDEYLSLINLYKVLGGGWQQ